MIQSKCVHDGLVFSLKVTSKYILHVLAHVDLPAKVLRSISSPTIHTFLYDDDVVILLHRLHPFFCHSPLLRRHNQFGHKFSKEPCVSDYMWGSWSLWHPLTLLSHSICHIYVTMAYPELLFMVKRLKIVDLQYFIDKVAGNIPNCIRYHVNMVGRNILTMIVLTYFLVSYYLN
jgi:hypothetical protein